MGFAVRDGRPMGKVGEEGMVMYSYLVICVMLRLLVVSVRIREYGDVLVFVALH